MSTSGSDYETVPVSGQQTVNVSGNEVLSNVLYDCTASDASVDVRLSDTASAVNIGFKGRNEASIHDDDGRRFGVHVRSSGEVLVENVYLGDGSVEGHNVPVFVNKNSTGSVTFRNMNIQNWPDNGIYGSTPGKSDGGGAEIHFRDSYVRNCVSGQYRASNGSMENCVSVNDAEPPGKIRASSAGPNKPKGSRVYGVRGLWIRNGGNFTVNNSDFYHPFRTTSYPIDADDDGSRITVDNSRIGPQTGGDRTDGDVTLNSVTGSPTEAAPVGVPMTAEEAAGGNSSADGRTIPPQGISGGSGGGGPATFQGAEMDSPIDDKFAEGPIDGQGKLVRMGSLEEDHL